MRTLILLTASIALAGCTQGLNEPDFELKKVNIFKMRSKETLKLNIT